MHRKDRKYFHIFSTKNTLVSVATMDSASSDIKILRELKEDEEPALVYFLRPVLSFLRLICFQHCSYKFVPSTGENGHVFYRYQPGSWIRKIISFLIALAVTIQFIAVIHWRVTLLGDHPSVAMIKIMGTFYIFASLSFCHSISTKGEKICRILNFIQEMSNCIGKAGCTFPSKKRICSGSISLLLFYIAFSLYFAFIGNGGLDCGNPVPNKNATFSGYFQNCGVIAMKQIVNLYQTAPNQTSFNITSATINSTPSTNHSVSDSPYLQFFVGILYVLVSFYSVLSWVMAKVLITSSAFLFWKVFSIFFKYTENVSSKNADTVQDIRRFYRITVTIQQFNDAFGVMILASVLAGVAHFSVNIMDMFRVTTDLSLKLLLAVSFIIFALELLAEAQVHKAAHEMADVITTRFQSEDWSNLQQVKGIQNDEATHGIMIVFHDLSTNKIGLRGLEFFTVTYSFIGTVLSMIATYSIVMTQLQSVN